MTSTWEQRARDLLWRAASRLWAVDTSELLVRDIRDFLAEPSGDVAHDVARIRRERDALLEMIRHDAATFRDFERASTVLGRHTVAEAARIAAESTELLIAACEKEEMEP